MSEDKGTSKIVRAHRPPYQRAVCLRCGFTVCVTNERGEAVERLETLYIEHVEECRLAPTRGEKREERRANRSIDFLRANGGERAAGKIADRVYGGEDP